MRHLCQTAPICASIVNMTLVSVLVLHGVCICARRSRKEQEGETKREHAMHSLSMVLQASLNREDSVNAAGRKACH